MGFREKVMPLVLSGTLAFGTMGVPMTALAGTVHGYNTSSSVSTVSSDLDKRVANGELTQAEADALLAKFRKAVAAENESAEQAMVESVAEPVAEETPAPAAEKAGSDESTADNGKAADNDGEKADNAGDDKNADGDKNADSDADDGSDEGENGNTGAEGDESGTEAGGDAGTEGDDPTAEGDNTGDNTGAEEGTPTEGETGSTDGTDKKEDATGGTGKTDTATDDATGAKADTDADKAADDKASKGKHAKPKKAVTNADKAAQYREKAKAYAENASGRADLDAATAVKQSTYDSSYTSSNQNYTRIKYTTNLSTEMFIASIGEQARQIGQDKSLYASVMIAQAVIESDSGNSGLAKAPYNNLFGIKGAYQGNSVTMSTQEDNGKGNLYTIDSAFRAYETQEESLKDYADLLRSDMGHYYNAWKENAATYQDAAKALQGTYATSTIYADTICAVIEAYDLTRYDEPLDFEITGKDADGKDLTMDDYAQLQANAVSYLGTPYVWGGTTPDGFDCSGFVQYLYKQTFGIDLPRTTYTQQNEGVEVSFKDLQMGDLLFFVSGGSTEHVAMYLGDGFYIHAPEPGDSIKITDMESFTPTFAKRIIKTKAVEDEAAAEKAADEKVAKAAHAKKDSKAADEKTEKAADEKAADDAAADEEAAKAEEAEA